MDLRVAMLAGGPEAAGVGRAAGCLSVRLLGDECGAPEPARAAAIIQACWEEDTDMILLALDAHTLAAQPGGGRDNESATCGALEWMDSLVRELNRAPGFRDTVLLTLVLGPGTGPAAAPLEDEDPPLIRPLSGTLSAGGQLVSQRLPWAPPYLRRAAAGHQTPRSSIPVRRWLCRRTTSLPSGGRCRATTSAGPGAWPWTASAGPWWCTGWQGW